MICVPIVSVGLSDVIGSWKIIAISRPRTSSSFLSESFVRSRPSNITEPETIFAGGFGIRPMIESAVTDFPQPDSPTIPSVSPFSIEKLTAVDRADDALAGEEVGAQVVDLEQRHALGLPGPGVECVAQAVRNEVGAEHERRDRHRGDDQRIDVRAVDGAAVVGHRTPRGVRRANTEADEREERLAEDHRGQLEEDGDDQHAERVREQVAAEDAVPPRAPRRVAART